MFVFTTFALLHEKKKMGQPSHAAKCTAYIGILLGLDLRFPFSQHTLFNGGKHETHRSIETLFFFRHLP